MKTKKSTPLIFTTRFQKTYFSTLGHLFVDWKKKKIYPVNKRQFLNLSLHLIFYHETFYYFGRCDNSIQELVPILHFKFLAPAMFPLGIIERKRFLQKRPLIYTSEIYKTQLPILGYLPSKFEEIQSSGLAAVAETKIVLLTICHVTFDLACHGRNVFWKTL